MSHVVARPISLSDTPDRHSISAGRRPYIQADFRSGRALRPPDPGFFPIKNGIEYAGLLCNKFWMRECKRAYPKNRSTGHVTPPIDMTGKQFGWLTVMHREGSTMRRGIKKNAIWRCVCTCGQQVLVAGNKLRRGKRKACCVNGHSWSRRYRGGLSTKYALEYSTWEKMRERCRNKNHHKHLRYGGRGIKVCARWNEFKNFLEDMGPRPSKKHSINRIDNDGNYEPGNCNWATVAEQARNTSRSVFIEYKGERMLLMDLCAKFGLNRSNVYGRLKNGWPLEHALFTPVNHYKKGKSK